MIKTFFAAKYIRSSCADNEAERRNTIGHQRYMIDAFLLDKPEIAAVSERIDENRSGVSFDRPALNEMIADILGGKIDCVIVKDLSRLGRNYVEVGRCLLDFFPANGVRFISINDSIDTLHEAVRGNMMVLLKNILNEHYSLDISQKTRAALTIRRKNGDHVGASVVYGYRKSEENRHRLIRDEYAAGIVQSIFSMKLQGLSAARIASKLNNDGILPPLAYKHRRTTESMDSSEWQAGTILRILKDENYTGILVQGRQSICSFKVRQVVNHPENKWVKIVDAHEPIISHSHFEQVQRLLQLDTRVSPREVAVYPFSGLLVCSCCGGRMTRRTSRVKDKVYTYYYCPTGKKNGCSYGGRIRASALEAGIITSIREYMRRILSYKGEFSTERVACLFQDRHHAQVNVAEKKRAENAVFRSGLYGALSTGLISQDDYFW